MKLIPAVITILTVILLNIIAGEIYELGEKSTQRLIISGILAIVVYETSYYFYKKKKKQKK